MHHTVIPSLQQIFRRDLLKLRQEIASYSDDEKIWHIEKRISNSAGNLCLHILGNLNTYVGAQLGGFGYQRNRDLEFSAKHVSRTEMIEMIEKTMLVVDSSLAKLDPETLESEYPEKVFSETMSIGFFLIHLATHLDYHLGQINYHRRLLDTLSLGPIASVRVRTFN